MTSKDIQEFFPDRPDAVKLLSDLWEVMQAWDDAQDGDGEHKEYAKAFKTSFLSIQQNPLYLQCNGPFLVAQCFYDWSAANRFESYKQELNKAYMLRAGYYRIIIALIHCLYGFDEAEKQAAAVWRCYREKFDTYKKEFD